MNQLSTRQLVKVAVIAAVYATLTAIFMSISFTPLQLRVSEAMVLLAYFNPLAIIGLTLGCFIANLLMSPFPLLDCIFGTLATLLSVSMVYYTGKVFKRSRKGLIFASIWPVLFNAVIVSSILCISGQVALEGRSFTVALLGTMCFVGGGEFIAVSIIGVLLIGFIMTQYKGIIEKI